MWIPRANVLFLFFILNSFIVFITLLAIYEVYGGEVIYLGFIFFWIVLFQLCDVESILNPNKNEVLVDQIWECLNIV